MSTEYLVEEALEANYLCSKHRIGHTDSTLALTSNTDHSTNNPEMCLYECQYHIYHYSIDRDRIA